MILFSYFGFGVQATLPYLGEDPEGYPEAVIRWHKEVAPILQNYQSTDGTNLGLQKNIALFRLDCFLQDSASHHFVIPCIFISGADDILGNEAFQDKTVELDFSKVGVECQGKPLQDIYINGYEASQRTSPFILFPEHAQKLREVALQVSNDIQLIKELMKTFLSESNRYGNFLNYGQFTRNNYKSCFMKAFQEEMGKLVTFENTQEDDFNSGVIQNAVDQAWPSFYTDEEKTMLNDLGIRFFNKQLERNHFHSEQAERFYILNHLIHILKESMKVNIDEIKQLIISGATFRDPCFACQDHFMALPLHLSDLTHVSVSILLSGYKIYQSKIKNTPNLQNNEDF